MMLTAGLGFVGKEIQKIFPESHILDLKKSTYDKNEIYDFCHICVPTPMRKDGACDISQVEAVIEKTQEKVVRYIIKSTIPPKTSELLTKIYSVNIVFSPEYVASSSPYPAPLGNIFNRNFFIFGGEKENTSKVRELYEKVYPPTTRFIEMSALEAEIVKYMENGFISTYVTFCNEFYEICKSFGVSYNKVREGFLADPRMISWWTYVREDMRGFSKSHCLPKDLNAIVKACEIQGYNPQFLKDILFNNERWGK